MGQAPQANVVYEGDVVGWVPVQAVAVESEGDGVEHPVDRPHHVLAIVHPEQAAVTNSQLDLQ